MSLVDSFQTNLGVANTVLDDSNVSRFDFTDFSDCDAGELVKLALRASAVRQRAESYLSAVLVRLGELESDDAVRSVCEQFDLPAYKTRRQARTAKGLSLLGDVVRAAKDGWIAQDHAELLAASHSRAPMSTEEQLDLLALGVQQSCDVFKNTVLKSKNTTPCSKRFKPYRTTTNTSHRENICW